MTDTEETEKNYFEGLRDSIPTELRERLVIKVEKAIRIAEQYYEKCEGDGKIKPSEMWPASMVQRLVEEIVIKIGKRY